MILSIFITLKLKCSTATTVVDHQRICLRLCLRYVSDWSWPITDLS